ncbi:hypothetical protein IFR05_007751 [Cadophora sp. M221]|nr:hypothetical protein IFR05_007751 [Cadophora sp. M221]
MSYISQMPFMRTRATEDGIAVNDILKYYRISLLRAQVRLDLDLSRQLYVAEHQTWASFWPGEQFPGVDPRTQVQATAPTPTIATTHAPAVGEAETTTSSTILREISTKHSPHLPFNSEPRSATPAKSQFMSQEHGRDGERHENGRERHTSEELVGEYTRDTEKTSLTHMSTSPTPSTPSPAPNPDKVICGNCSEAGHSLAECTHDIDEYGFLNGCPRCNTRQHNYADCPGPKHNHDNFHYLISKRHGKPPIRCSWDYRKGYRAKFKGYKNINGAEVKRPQTAAFAMERRYNGVVQAWDEIVLDPSWYGPNGWTNHVEDQVHPLDKGRPNTAQVVDLSGSEVLSDDELAQQKRKWSADGSMKVDEYGRLAQGESNESSMGDGYMQDGSDQFQENLRGRSLRPTMQPWIRNRQDQRSQDERSWKKRRAEDKRTEEQRQSGGMNVLNQGVFNPPSGPRGLGDVGNGQIGGAGNKFQQVESNDPFRQGIPRYGNDPAQDYWKLQEQNPTFQQQGGGGFRGSYISPLSTPGQHPLHPGQGFGNVHPQYISHQMNTPYIEQQTMVLYNADNNPFPPIHLESRTDDHAQAPLPGCIPPQTPEKSANNNGHNEFTLQNQANDDRVNSQRGGFKNQNRGQRQMNGRGHGQGQRGGFGHQNGRNAQTPHQEGFQFRDGALPPVQPLSRAGMQVDGLRAQAAERFSGFGTQHGIAHPALLAPKPMSTGISSSLVLRGQNIRGQRGGNGMQNIHGGNGQGNRQFNAGPTHMPRQRRQSNGRAAVQASPPIQVPQPGLIANEAGYCVNCRSQGHVAEECGGSCVLCRAGGHKARECRFISQSKR